MRGNRCTTSACDALAAEQCNATPHRAIPTYPVQYPRATSTIKNPDSTASVEDTGGSRESSCGARGQRQSLADHRDDLPTNFDYHSPTGVEGAGGSGGHGRASRSTTPSEARVWRSRGRPGPKAPATPAAPQATTSSAERSSRRGRLAGGPPPTAQPGPTAHQRRPEHPQRRKQPGPDTRKPRPADAGRGQPTQSGGKV